MRDVPASEIRVFGGWAPPATFHRGLSIGSGVGRRSHVAHGSAESAKDRPATGRPEVRKQLRFARLTDGPLPGGPGGQFPLESRPKRPYLRGVQLAAPVQCPLA
ncbi:hypothetical protein GCM10009779_40290 [Polymorphospora rubra]|uniref:Uncharacterized protein n=1 Tax=Polymorphospora rubra TaxID=338584 RepID=A0A810N869_9ACTN|nr:hypothetical protein Prubr_62310 [Polymorphospora rubra]